MINGNGEANEAKEELIRTAQRAHRLEIALVALAGLAVVVASATAVVVGLGNRSRQAQTQKATASAVQVILDYVDDTMGPHRLRNEAENRCGVEVIYQMLAGPLVQAADHYTGLYDACVLRRSGITAPPPVPPNPLTTTTTRR